MAIKHLVVDGAICMCTFGVSPDLLKVLTNKKEYANDAKGIKKLIASTMDIGSPFQLGTFGACSKLLGGPCKSIVLQWSGFYSPTQLNNGGFPLLEDSKATCPIGAPDCIRIIFHGQITEINKMDCFNAKPLIVKALNPAVKISEIREEQGIVVSK
jgi:hypothetical protein